MIQGLQENLLRDYEHQFEQLPGCEGLHQRSYGIEFMVESLFRDRSVSWVRLGNGINKYVNETRETISLENVEKENR